MAADHLFGNGFADIVDVEPIILTGDPCHEDYLQEQIPELLTELGRIAVVNGVDHLVGFLEEVGRKGVKGLLAIPRTSPGIAQTIHDGNETIEAF